MKSAIISNYQISDALQKNTDLGFNVTNSIVTQAGSNSNLSSSSRSTIELNDIFTSFGPVDSTPVYGPMTKEDYEKSKNKANGDILSSFLGLFKKPDPNTPTPPFTTNQNVKKTPIGYYLVGAAILLKLFKRK
jgi:hypothetical protein